MVTDSEIERMLSLSAEREFAAALTLAQGLLDRVDNHVQRMVILYTFITCSTWLGLPKQSEAAAQALGPLVGTDVASVFAAMTQAAVEVEAGRASEALNIINKNLAFSFMHTQDYKDWLYDQLVLKGHALTRLARCPEALSVLDEATAVLSSGKYDADILVSRSNCLMAMGEYEDAFIAAESATTKGDQELTALAMLYMAECRMWQGRIQEALALYVQLEKRLPRKFVDTGRVQAGIRNATNFLEKRSPQAKIF